MSLLYRSDYFYGPLIDAKTNKLCKGNSSIDNGTGIHSTNSPEKKAGGSGKSRKNIECVIENYVCCFCKYKGSHQDLENHYYDIHEEAIRRLPGIHLSRKIDILIINCDKYFKSSLRL